MYKICKKCLRELSLDLYHKNMRRKDERENKCKECTNSERQNPIKRESNLNAQKKWRDNNKDYQSKWRKNNLDRLQYEKNYYKENKDKYIIRKQLWRINNPIQEAETRKK